MEDCIFCKIVDKSIPANIVYEDDDAVAFHDVSPQAPIHVLIVPKKHFDNITQLDTATAQHLFSHCVQTVAKMLNLADGFRLIVNTGKIAGQSVPHLHIHILAGKILGENLL